MKLVRRVEDPVITVEVYSEEFDFIIKLGGGVIEDAMKMNEVILWI